MGGYITFQECLKVILVAIAIVELLYLLFNVVYITYIDPQFLEKLKGVTQEFMVKSKVPDETINETLSKFDTAGKMTVWSVIQSYGFSIIIDAIFGVIIALILKKKRPVFESIN